MSAIRCPAAPRPRRLDCLLLALFFPMAGAGPHLFMLGGYLGQEAARALVIPRSIGVATGVGVVLGVGVAILALMYAHQTRYRAAFLDDERLILGTLDPPRGAILRWADIAGFRCRAGGIVLRVRGAPWTRILGPIIACDGVVMHRVVERLESHGVRRLDG